MVRKVSGKPWLLVPTRPRSIEPSLAEKIRPFKDHNALKSQEQIDEERRLAGLVRVLGAKSYWLQSASAATEERQRKEQAEFDSLRTKPSLHRTVESLDREVLEVPIIDRRDEFYTNLEKERVKRTAIRFLEEEMLEGLPPVTTTEEKGEEEPLEDDDNNYEEDIDDEKTPN